MVGALERERPLAALPDERFRGSPAHALSRSQTDGAGRLAVVAEIGCAPKHRPRNREPGRRLREDDRGRTERRGAVVEPTVAWVPSQSAWLVRWIAVSGGAHGGDAPRRQERAPRGGNKSGNGGRPARAPAADGS